MSGDEEWAEGPPKKKKSVYKSAADSVSRVSMDRLLKVMRALNILNALLLAVACFFSFTILSNITGFFLGTYMGLFAVLLFAFETRLKRWEPFIRKWFGFLYTYMGRAAFLLFLSAVNFGVAGTGSDAGVGKAVVVIAGVFTVTNAVFNGFVICNHPAFRANKTQQNLKDEDILTYLDNHPELARRAAAKYAAESKQEAGGVSGYSSSVDTAGYAGAGDGSNPFLGGGAGTGGVASSGATGSSHYRRGSDGEGAPIGGGSYFKDDGHQGYHGQEGPEEGAGMVQAVAMAPRRSTLPPPRVSNAGVGPVTRTRPQDGAPLGRVSEDSPYSLDPVRPPPMMAAPRPVVTMRPVSGSTLAGPGRPAPHVHSQSAPLHTAAVAAAAAAAAAESDGDGEPGEQGGGEQGGREEGGHHHAPPAPRPALPVPVPRGPTTAHARAHSQVPPPSTARAGGGVGPGAGDEEPAAPGPSTQAPSPARSPPPRPAPSRPATTRVAPPPPPPSEGGGAVRAPPALPPRVKKV